MFRQLFGVRCFGIALVLVMGAAVFLISSPAAAQKEGDNAVKEISLKDLKLPLMPAKTSAFTPTKITSAEDLAKTFPEKATQEAIAKQVDFMKQELVFFQWAGSGGDKIQPDVAKGDVGKSTVTFFYKLGLTKDLRDHARLFAVNKDMQWMVSK